MHLKVLLSLNVANISTSYEALLNDVCDVLAGSLDDAIKNSAVGYYSFCWKLVVGICEKLNNSEEKDHFWVFKYSRIILILGKIHHSGQSSQAYSLPSTMDTCKLYVDMVEHLHNVLRLLRKNYSEGFMNYEDLDNYSSCSVVTKNVATIYLSDQHVASQEEIRQKMDHFHISHVELSKLLLRSAGSEK